jgi:hypothetical protein
MATASDAADSALAEVDRLRKLLKKKSTAQVRADDERSIIKATALAWFNAHRATIAPSVDESSLRDADRFYKELLEGSGRATSRGTYDDTLKALREIVIGLRTAGLAGPVVRTTTTDQPPDFGPLIGDPQMQQVLGSRWDECTKCLRAEAPLSATVMMGGLLEALLLGRINRETNKASIFQAKAAPRDKGGQPKNLTDWTLKNYIDVAHENGWITVAAKDVSEVLRDYRNYIHPFKQLSHRVQLTPEDASLLWEVSKVISRQVIKSANP